MKTVFNPEKGAPIKNFLFKKKLYALGIGQKLILDDEIANALFETYPFLEEPELEGQYVCKFGDFASDKKIAVLGHERSHKETPEVETQEFITPQERLDFQKRKLYDAEGIPEGEGKDRDGFEWYGPGLETDNDVRAL